MAIEGSVNVSLVAGLNTINLPSDNLTIVGMYPFSVSVSVQVNPGMFANLPQPNPEINPQHQLIRFTLKMSTSQLIVNSSGNGNLIVYYGTPLPGSKELSSYSGVSTTVAFASAGATSQTLTIAMPKSGATLVGIIAMEAQTGYEYSLVLNTSAGKSLTFYSVPGQIASTEDIVPLNIPNVANNFTVIVSTSSTAATNTMTFILYYR